MAGCTNLVRNEKELEVPPSMPSQPRPKLPAIRVLITLPYMYLAITSSTISHALRPAQNKDVCAQPICLSGAVWFARSCAQTWAGVERKKACSASRYLRQGGRSDLINFGFNRLNHWFNQLRFGFNRLNRHSESKFGRAVRAALI